MRFVFWTQHFLLNIIQAIPFILGNLQKWQPGVNRILLLNFHIYKNKNLCVCFHIDLYLKGSVSWRSQGESQLLLSFVNPHKLVKPCTVSRWIIEVLSAAGIDTSTFKGHSTRSATTSKASSLGVPLKEIIKRGHWSATTTFERIYKKNIGLGTSDTFETAIFH